MIPTPCAFSSRMTRKRLSTSLSLERGRGLVHDEDAGVGAEGTGDLDELLLGHREPAHLGLGVDRRADPIEQPSRPRRAARPSGRAARRPPAPAPARCSRRPSGRGTGPAAGRSPRSRATAARTGSLSFDRRGPGPRSSPRRAVGPGDDLDQRRLPRAVLADQRVDLPGPRSNETPLSAWTPANALLMPVSLRSVGTSALVSIGQVQRCLWDRRRRAVEIASRIA